VGAGMPMGGVKAAQAGEVSVVQRIKMTRFI
jgi:hypothetical protein